MSIQIELKELGEKISRLEILSNLTIYDDNIIEGANKLHIEPMEYLNKCEHDYVDRQRDYNRLIDENPELKGYEKYVIDTYDLDNHWMRCKRMDPIEINLAKRLREDTGRWCLKSCHVLTEDERYRFYSVVGRIVREDKITGQAVDFAAYSEKACMYKGKLYWFENSGICDDVFICRCNADDGQQFEQFEWLSNKKVIFDMGTSVHLSSEDCVIEMHSDDDALIITVRRGYEKTKRYQLIITDNGKELKVKKRRIYKWKDR